MDSVRRGGEQVVIAVLWVTLYPLLVLMTGFLDWWESGGNE